MRKRGSLKTAKAAFRLPAFVALPATYAPAFKVVVIAAARAGRRAVAIDDGGRHGFADVYGGAGWGVHGYGFVDGGVAADGQRDVYRAEAAFGRVGIHAAREQNQTA